MSTRGLTDPVYLGSKMKRIARCVHVCGACGEPIMIGDKFTVDVENLKPLHPECDLDSRSLNYEQPINTTK